MAKERILIAEDDLDVVKALQDRFEYLGYQVVIAYNGKEALEHVEHRHPDLIVLDVMMPEMDGYEVCSRLRSSPKTQHIPILMLTAKGQQYEKEIGLEKGADDYLLKPYSAKELQLRVEKLLRRSARPQYIVPVNALALSLNLKPGQPLHISMNGDEYSDNQLRLNTKKYARHAGNCASHADWRFYTKDTGERLYRIIFGKHPKALKAYERAVGAITSDEMLHIRIKGERDLLRVPLEFLFAEHQYFVRRHPLARSINGIYISKKTISPTFLNNLCQEQEPLRILLIASNTGNIPAVDQEIESIKIVLEQTLAACKLSASIKILPTNEASYENVRQELKNGRYHLVHYAGHGTYCEESPELTHLSFWELPNQQGQICKMPVTELQHLIKNSEIRFFYLSCCEGTTTGTPEKLLDDDFLGIADGLVHAGVPAVLGFRWAVSDRGAKLLAEEFYKSLAAQGAVDTALLHARCEIAAKYPDDRTWVSPILIMQE